MSDKKELAEKHLEMATDSAEWGCAAFRKTPNGRWEMFVDLNEVPVNDFFVLNYLLADSLNNIRSEMQQERPGPLPMARHIIDPTKNKLSESVEEGPSVERNGRGE